MRVEEREALRVDVLGVTASRGVPRPAALHAATRLLDLWSRDVPGWLHHGDCVGGDEALAAHASERWLLHSHPAAVAPQHQANLPAALVEPRKPALERNQDIVDAVAAAIAAGRVGRLLAMPRSHMEEVRSGTWATVRRAWQAGVPVTIVWPNGHVEDFEERPRNHWRIPDRGEEN